MTPSELRTLLDQRLPEPRRELLEAVGRLAAQMGLPVYIVGGFVRDLLLDGEQAPGDFDFVVDGDAPALARAVARELGGRVTVHAPFGTATWFSALDDGATIDFAMARTETYPQPAVLPRVTPATIDADLQRRDFTINTLALRVDGEHCGELLDLHQAQADLAARVIRVLHPLSFQDDPTRIFRAVRYTQRLDFQLTGETLALIPEALTALTLLTGERVRHELELIFREPRATAMLTVLEEWGVLQKVHPSLRWDARKSALASTTLPVADWKMDPAPEPEAFYLGLLLMEAAPLEVARALTRLSVNREVSHAVQAAVSLVIEGGTRPSEVVACLEGFSELALAVAYVLHEASRAHLNDYLAHWRFVQAETTGDDLIALGLTPGPQFKYILWELRAACLDGQVADRDGERVLIDKLVNEKLTG